jgi:hypothetical protein
MALSLLSASLQERESQLAAAEERFGFWRKKPDHSLSTSSNAHYVLCGVASGQQQASTLSQMQGSDTQLQANLSAMSVREVQTTTECLPRGASCSDFHSPRVSMQLYTLALSQISMLQFANGFSVAATFALSSSRGCVACQARASCEAELRHFNFSVSHSGCISLGRPCLGPAGFGATAMVPVLRMMARCMIAFLSLCYFLPVHGVPFSSVASRVLFRVSFGRCTLVAAGLGIDSISATDLAPFSRAALPWHAATSQRQEASVDMSGPSTSGTVKGGKRLMVYKV